MKIEEILNKVICGDCLEKLKDLEDNSVDSIVTDPPYHLVSIVKRFGKEGSAPAKEGKDGSFKRLSGGFMGKTWDGVDENGKGIAYNVDMWKECLRVLKPGGHLLAFGGTRTYHRMASAIEDAGFEVRDMIEWVYGSGFPKSHNIGKNIEKIKVGGIKNLKQIGTKKGIKVETGTQGFSYSKEYVAGKSMGGKQISGDIPVYEINNEWGGWGTALKPAHEPICMARKPLSEKTVAENCLKWGTGGINIDESRVEAQGQDLDKLNSEWDREWNTNYTDYAEKVGGNAGFNMDKAKKKNAGLTGRFPANLILGADENGVHEEVRECFPETTVGARKAGQLRHTKDGDLNFTGDTYTVNDYPANSGNASRFFKSIVYIPKASKSERNCGLDSIVLLDIMEVWKENNTTKEEKLIRLVVSGLSPEKVIVESGTAKKKDKEWNTFLFGKELMEKYQQDTGYIIKTETNSITVLETWNYLMHLLTKGYIQGVKLETATGGNLVGSVESYSELIITINEKTASLLGVKNAVSPTQLKISVKEGSNFHSTVKPIALMEYLIKMVTPKGGTVLDPFAGSGSTLVAAKQNGFQYIGIELTEEYIPIIEARLNSPTQDKLL